MKTFPRIHQSPHFGQKNQGAVLFVSLILLIILSLLAITSAQVSVLQEHMSGNFRAMQRSFERAETRMVEGRKVVSNPLTAYDQISDAPVNLLATNLSPWSTQLGSATAWSEKAVRACGGACPERRGSSVGLNPLVRFYILTSQEKDPGSSADSAAWSAVQTIQVY